MKVGVVMPQGQMAGAERVLLELLEETPPSDVVVFAPVDSAFGDEVRQLGYPVRDFAVPKLVEAGSRRRYARALASGAAALGSATRREGVTLLHAFLPLTLKVAVPVARATRTPVIASVHDITSAESIGRLRSTVQRRLVTSSVPRVIAVSEFVARTLRATGYPDDAIRVIHNGIRPRPGAALDRAALDLPADATVFAVVARLTPWKGQAVAVEALARFRRSHPEADAHLVVAGGPFEPGDEAFAAELREQAARLGVDAAVRFIGHQADAWPVYRLADAVLVPSTRPDPFPTVVLEAGLAGRPVVVTDLGGGQEAVVDGTTGLVSPPTPDAFAAAMARVADAGWRRAAGDAAERHVAERFNRPDYARRIFAEWRAFTR